MRIRPGIEVAVLSDVGQRENNEDRYSYWEPEEDDQFQRKGRLLSVADGMGGYVGGQEASRIAIETVEERYAADQGADVQACLVDALEEAHRRIKQQASEQSALHGMGTTCTAVVLLNSRIYFAHVGDSRLYLIRKRSITKLTHDHSYVGRMVESGLISSQDAETHPQRHILTAALGAGESVIPDTPEGRIDVEQADLLVLCTDGLWGMLTEAEIQAAADDQNPERACETLVEMVKQRGGADNITVLILRVV